MLATSEGYVDWILFTNVTCGVPLILIVQLSQIFQVLLVQISQTPYRICEAGDTTYKINILFQ